MRCIDCEHCDFIRHKCRRYIGAFLVEHDLDMFGYGYGIYNQRGRCDYFKPIKVKIKIKKRLTNGK